MFESDRIQGTAIAATPAVLSDEELVGRADEAWHSIGRAHRDLLDLLREVARRETWRDDGAQDLTHWVSMRYGLSAWKAQRWVAAADALASLPLVAHALEAGVLGVDRAVELTRFATLETERDLILWAARRSSGAIRHRGDLERRRERHETRAAETERFLRMGYSDDGMRFELDAELPADQGAVVERALSRVAEQVPDLPDDLDEGSRRAPLEVRRADALVQLCSGRIAADPDHDRATVVVHASVETLLGSADATNAEVEDGPVLAPVTAQRLACDARLQISLDDVSGTPLKLGRLSRTPSPAMVRALRRRDRACRFPGCERRRYTDAHHVRWWSRGGRTDLHNLVLLCGFHHRLVHEAGWSLHMRSGGRVEWFRPDGRRYRAGPSPPGSVPLD